MTKRVLGVLAALAMMGGSAVACSSSTTPAPAAGTDAGKDTGAGDTGAKPDTRPAPVDTETPTDKTTGKACATNEDCDITGEAVNVCSKGAFGGNSLYPTDVCIGTSCDIPDPTKVTYCDGDTGVCLSTSSGGICLPLCTWKDDGAAPTGCEGKNACNPYAWGTDSSTMAVVGIGYCFGGCKADADCGTGQKCETATGLCVKTPDVYTKNVGDACTDTDSKDPSKCNCLYATNAAGTKSGSCSQFCKMGDTASACPTGFTCDAMLPKTKIADDDIVFTKAPTGMAGYCLKDCTADTDCEANNGYCEESAGTGKKTCQPGLRPCMKNEQCTGGKTCQGATATSYGRCKA